MTHGRYHPVTQCKLTGGVRCQQQPHRAAHAASRASRSSPPCVRRPSRTGRDPLTFQGLNPSGRASRSATASQPPDRPRHAQPARPAGFWRGVNINQNAIYLECFIDELAHAAGQDPLEFRRKLMSKHPKHLAVLNAVAERVGWGKPAPQGVFRGIAQMMAFGSYVAAAPKSRSPTATRSRSTASSAPPIRATPSTRRRSSGRSPGSFVYGLSALFYRGVHGQGRRASSRPTSTPTTRCGSRRCRRSSRSSCRPAVLGRRRRADDLRGRAGGAQRVFQGDRQAHPLVPAEEPRHPDGVTARSGGRTGRRFVVRPIGRRSRPSAMPGVLRLLAAVQGAVRANAT